MKVRSVLQDIFRAGYTDTPSFYAVHERDDILFHPEGLLNFGYWTSETRSKLEADRNFCRFVADAAPLGPGNRVLDAGCGYGRHDVFFRDECGVASIVAFDLSSDFIEEARRLDERGTGIEFRVGDAVRSGCPDASFDRVVSFDAAQHFRTRAAFLAEAYRVLEPGGVLLVTDLILLRLPVTFGERLRLRKESWESAIPMANQYGAAKYEQLLREIGFVDVTIRSIIHRTLRGFLRYAAERVREEEEAGTSQKALEFARELHLGLRVDYERETLDHVVVRAVKP